MLAYGGFHFADETQDLSIAVSTLISVVVTTLLAYAPATLLAESAHRPRRVLAVPVYAILIVALAVFTWAYTVTGEFGPRHVAMDVSGRIVPALLFVLIFKLVWLCMFERRTPKAGVEEQAAPSVPAVVSPGSAGVHRHQ